MGILYIASYLEREGHSVEVADLSTENPSSKLSLPNADVYGISAVTPQVKDAQNIIEVIKDNHDVPVVGGGPHATALPEDMLKRGCDAVVTGEGEIPMTRALHDFEVRSLRPIYNEEVVQDLDTIPFPARHLMPDSSIRTHDIMKSKYAEGGTTCIIGGRGCPFKCSFCPNIIRKVRYRSPHNIVKEIKKVVGTYGIYQFKFQDDCFTLVPRWLFKLCDGLEKLEVYFRCITRADRLSKEVAKRLYKAGCRDVSFGTESGSNKVLKINNKLMTVEENEKAYRNAKEAGLTTICNLIFGLPGEDQETIRETKEFFSRNREFIDVVNLGVFVPYPGTDVWNDPDKFDVEILTKDFEKYWFVGHQHDDFVFVRNRQVSLKEMKQLKVDMFKFVEELGYAKPEWSAVK